MNDEQKPDDQHDTVEQPAEATSEPTPAPPAPDAAKPTDAPGTPAPVASRPTPRTRNTLIAGGAGLALAGGLVGFGIGNATADDGGHEQFRPAGRYAPGDGRPDLGDGQRPGGRGGFDDRGQSGDGEGGNQPNGADDPT